MSEGWPQLPLREICDVLDKLRKPITKRDRIAGDYPYYGATGILDYVEDYIFDELLILIGEDGAKWGAGENTAFAANGKYWVNNHAHVIRPHRDLVDDRWIIHYLNHANLSPFITGLTVPKLNQGKLNSIPIPLPPLAEQKRIVSIFVEAFAAIAKAKENAEQNLANAKELFESYLNKVFTEKGEGWEEKTLGELSDVVSGQHINTKDYNTDGKGIGYLTGPSDFGRTQPTVSKWTEYPKRTAISGDVLITVKGSGVGKVNIANAQETCISRQLMAIRSKILHTHFLFAFLQTRFEYFQTLATGAAIPGISREDVLGLKVAYPVDDQEQERVVKSLTEAKSSFANLHSTYQQKITDLDELKQSILQKAFTGQLTSKSPELESI